VHVLITGAAGFIGSHLHDRLNADGHDVVGVDNFLTGNNNPDIVHRCDIVNRHALYDIANGLKPELVIHCAASYSDPSLWHRDAETNILGTINATLVAKHHGARLFYFNTALPPISSYAISKIAGQQYIEQSGVDAITFRLANIYGPRNLSGPIPTFFRRITNGEPCTIVNTERDTVYIDDLVNLVGKAMDGTVWSKDVTNARVAFTSMKVYDVCSGNHYPILRYFEAVRMAMNSNAVVNHADAEANDVKNMELDPAAAAFDFNWLATTDLQDGVAKAVAWYQEHGVTQTFSHLSNKG